MNILDSLPIHEQAFDIPGPMGSVKIFPYQIAAKVSLVVRGQRSKIFPAVFDTGFNRHFGLSEHHLRDWLNFDPAMMKVIGSFTLDGEVRHERAADIEIHPNVPGSHSLSDRPPFRLNLQEHGGISILPDNTRMPLIGITSLVRCNLRLVVDGRAKSVTLSEGGKSSWFAFWTGT